jgi:succinate dehydrogenase / fumarate reductase cytochrome b subunit
MGLLVGFLRSSIGKKIIVALTGLFLCFYLVVHVAGNLLLFKHDGGAAFDTYAETLPSLLIIRIVEVGLFLVFLAHMIVAVYTWWENKRARPTAYAVNRPQENSSFFSRFMFVSGSIVAIFLVIHMRSFWAPARFAPQDNPSMYYLVKEAFASPVYSLFYVAAMVLLAFHLRHGFQSAFQTLGLKEKKYTPLIEAVGALFWLVIPLAFAAMPIAFLLNL